MIDSLVGALDLARDFFGSSRGTGAQFPSICGSHASIVRPSSMTKTSCRVRSMQLVRTTRRSDSDHFPRAILEQLAMRIGTQASVEGLNTWKGGKIPGTGLWLMPPASYLDFLGLVDQAGMVMTDSGGIQEETTYLGIPCLTYRNNTERPVTVTMGTNRLIGSDPQRLLESALEILDHSESSSERLAPVRPPLWDGAAALRIVRVLKDYLGCGPAPAQGDVTQLQPSRE